jgi:hypothetical protein
MSPDIGAVIESLVGSGDGPAKKNDDRVDSNNTPVRCPV